MELKIFNKKNKNAQIWVETVIYTLIGLIVIGVLLSVANPQIQKIKDRNIIEQTIISLNTLDEKIIEIGDSVGNIRIINFKIQKGVLKIIPGEDKIEYLLEDTLLELTEVDQEIEEGNIIIKTIENGNKYSISLTMTYSDLNLTFNNLENTKTLQASPGAYKIQMENLGNSINFNLLN